MQEPEEVVYYELPAFYADRLILPMYDIVKGIIVALPGLAFDPDFAEMHDSVKESMKVTDPEMPFVMTHNDCLVVCEMMSVLKFYFYRVVMPDTDVRDSLTEADKKIMEMYETCMTHIHEIGSDIVAVFPALGERFYQNETMIKNEKEAAKTLGLNKTTMIIQFSLVDEEWAIYMNTLFVFFDFFIMQSESDFSERVRAADFCCVTEVHEVHEILKSAMAATKFDKEYTTSFSLRDVVVVLMLNNISQKAYFSDIGDEIHNLYDDVMQKFADYKPGNLRNYMLKRAKLLEDYVYNIAVNTQGFEEAMKPILAFAV